MADDQLLFRNRQAFRRWLQKNHQSSSGTWLVFGKTATVKTLTANEALEEALCFGWIDGQLKSLGADSYLKRFTPRRRSSAWSARNRSLAASLIASGTMTQAGHAAIAQAKAQGTWDLSTPKPISSVQVSAFIDALRGHDKALANLLKMSPSVQRTYTAVYLSAKQEQTRQRRLAKIIERLNENKKPM